MRPVERGPVPTDLNGNSKVYKQYQDACHRFVSSFRE